MMIKFLLNPRTWIVLILVGIVWFFVHTMEQNKQLKSDLLVQEDKIELLETETATLKAGQDIIKEDILRIDVLAQEKQKVIIREIEIRRELDEIPKTIDTPFADDNNFAYAQRVRTHQIDTLSKLTRSNDN